MQARKINAILLAAIALPSLAGAQSAQVEGLTNTLENLIDSLTLIEAIKTRKLPTDALALQGALNRVLDLSVAELEGLQTKLNAINQLSDEYQAMRDQYHEQLSGLRLHWEDVREAINQNIALNTIIARARNLKEWRETIYQPALAPVVNFIAVFHNQEAINVAQRRLASIMGDEKNIKRIVAKNRWVTFAQLIKKAQAAIEQAGQLNNRAQQLLIKNNPLEEKGDVETLVATANKQLQQAYNLFLLMNELLFNRFF